MPASSSSSGQGATAQTGIAFALLLAVMVFTPLFRAGATPLAALISQLLAVGLLATVLWSPQRIVITAAQAIVLALLILLPALYLIPLPVDMQAALPGRDLYTQAQQYLAAPPAEPPSNLAIVPSAAGAAVLALLLPISVFLGVRVLKPAQIELLVGLFIAIAALQALLGLLQYGTISTGGSALVVEGASWGSAVGTYANRNHLAGLLEMVLPVTLALLFYTLSRLKRGGGDATALKRRIASVGSRPGQAAILYAALVLLLVVGVVFTRSRTGIALTILGILIASVLFSRQLGRKSALGPAGAILALALAGAVSIGLAPVLDRFSMSGLEGDARWQIFDQALLGGGALFPIGSGPGGFPEVFPAFQPQEWGGFFVNRAHNQYLEWFFDLGPLGIVLPALLLALYLQQWWRILRLNSDKRVTYIQLGCGVGVFLLALHETVDYNLHTPASQVAFAVLLSVFLYPAARLAGTDKIRTHRERRTPDLVPRQQPTPISVAPPTDQIDNPFLVR